MFCFHRGYELILNDNAVDFRNYTTTVSVPEGVESLDNICNSKRAIISAIRLCCW